MGTDNRRLTAENCPSGKESSNKNVENRKLVSWQEAGVKGTQPLRAEAGIFVFQGWDGPSHHCQWDRTQWEQRSLKGGITDWGRILFFSFIFKRLHNDENQIWYLKIFLGKLRALYLKKKTLTAWSHISLIYYKVLKSLNCTVRHKSSKMSQKSKISTLLYFKNNLCTCIEIKKKFLVFVLRVLRVCAVGKKGYKQFKAHF